jgi:hypothetical protein
MFNKKLFTSILLALAVMLAQVGIVAAAPPAQDGTTTTITGTIQTIAVDPDTNIVVVTVLLEDQVTTQTVSLDPLDPAYSSLFNPDTHELLVQVGDEVAWEVNSEDVIPDEEPVEEDIHPIAMLLANFFDEDPSVLSGYHEDGFGFGLIAQALWMSESINGDTSAAGLILEAKRSGDYSAFELPDGSSPANWGQFKKAILQKDKKNLGLIVSGHAEDDAEESATQQDHGNGKDKNKDKGKGKGKDKKNNHP